MLVIEDFIMTILDQSSKFYKRFHNKLHNHFKCSHITYFILSRPTRYNPLFEKKMVHRPFNLIIIDTKIYRYLKKKYYK